jgi:PPK2 family polyphosphate:nucleotide phosphotransferase
MSRILKQVEKDTVVLSKNKKVKMKDFDCNPKHGFSRDEIEAKLAVLHEEMFELQAKLYAEGKKSLLIVLQAMDAGGKDGTIKSVFTGLNPQACEVSSFKEPSKEELAHDYLWRIHKQVPPRGVIGIFNRSHYEDVTAARVEKYVPTNVWQRRYADINYFEKLLSDEGVVIRKFFLNVSKKEQKKRFQARLDVARKHWKFSKNDVLKRKKWDDYMHAFEDVFSKCSKPYAPWIIVPADDKPYRNLIVAKEIVDTLKMINPKFPEVQEDLANVKIPN